MSAGSRIAGRYRSFAQLFGHVVLVLILANSLLWAWFSVRDHRRAENRRAGYLMGYSSDISADLYPALGEDEIARLFAETWDRRVVYEPYTQYREAPFAGEFVNVHEAGFRVGSPQQPWPPNSGDLTVFLFGGSTMFGYGVPDDDTIGSYLARELHEPPDRAVAVFNFGSAGYYSTQERIRFELLATRGYRPDVAVFLDGLNEFVSPDDEPIHTDSLKRLFLDPDGNARDLVRALPMTRLARSLRKRMLGDDITEADSSTTVDSIVERYLRVHELTRASCGALGITCVFAWQPVPVYGYDLTVHPFVGPGLDWYGRAEAGYAEMQRRHSGGGTGDGFLWLADMQIDLREPLYVDTVHYTGAMSKRIAGLLARAIEALPPFAASPVADPGVNPASR